jgi:ubiquinone biosynthesis monooxygenase Coq7
MIRVNQAGEYGAVRIYTGQLSALSSPSAREIVTHMRAQEQAHLDTFNEMLRERRIRPTFLFPLWHIGGYALGYITGKLGEKAAMACTAAIEEVIDQHYAEQEKTLETFPEEASLKERISQFRVEELEHRDISIAHGIPHTPFYNALTISIKIISRAAIWLSKRF